MPTLLQEDRFLYVFSQCRKLRGKVGVQEMADLTKERFYEDPLFSRCGADIFRPLVEKEQRSELRHYGAMFTCMASRAVHIKVTCLLDVDLIIQALRCSVARRGYILWSDNGRKFIGPNRELWKISLGKILSKMKYFLGLKGADFIIWKKPRHMLAIL